MNDSRTNQEWISQLTGGEGQEEAIADLRGLLLRASLYCFHRNLNGGHGLTGEEIFQRAEDCAQDALLTILDHLADFRGDSKFSTWAYKFAINTALMGLRHERWKGVSLDGMDESWQGAFSEWVARDQSDGADLENAAQRQELHTILRTCIERDLTDKQRQVLVLIVFKEVPMDEVVRHLGSNRNSVYKLLHDARKKLKIALEEHGYESTNADGWVETMR